MHYSRIRAARARQTPTSLFSRDWGERGGGGFFFFTTKQLSGVCQLIGTRSTIIILLLRMNESSVAVFFLFFFFTGICDENGWRIDNETRARSRNYEPDSGGSEIIVCNLNRETRRFGWNVSVEICLIRLIIHTRLITRFKNNSMGTYRTTTTITVYTYHPRVIIYHIIIIFNARVYGTVCNDVMLYTCTVFDLNDYCAHFCGYIILW